MVCVCAVHLSSRFRASVKEARRSERKSTFFYWSCDARSKLIKLFSRLSAQVWTIRGTSHFIGHFSVYYFIIRDLFHCVIMLFYFCLVLFLSFLSLLSFLFFLSFFLNNLIFYCSESNLYSFTYKHDRLFYIYFDLSTFSKSVRSITFIWIQSPDDIRDS